MAPVQLLSSESTVSKGAGEAFSSLEPKVPLAVRSCVTLDSKRMSLSFGLLIWKMSLITAHRRACCFVVSLSSKESRSVPREGETGTGPPTEPRQDSYLDLVAGVWPGKSLRSWLPGVICAVGHLPEYYLALPLELHPSPESRCLARATGRDLDARL